MDAHETDEYEAGHVYTVTETMRKIIVLTSLEFIGC